MFLLAHSYLSRVAQRDLEKIFCEKISDKGTWIAWMEMELIRELIDELSTSPDRGDCRDDIWQGVLSIQHEDSVVYYRRNLSQLGVDILSVGPVADDPKYAPMIAQYSAGASAEMGKVR